MKLSLTMFFTVLSFLSSTMAFASLAHDGYIVKTKASHQFNKSVFNDIQKIGSEMGHFYVVKGERQAIEDLKLNSNVLYIEPNYMVKLNPIEDGHHVFTNETLADSKFKKQWGLKNTGINGGSIFAPGKKGEDINAENAWRHTRGRRDIVVAVIDTGIDHTHNDLQANLWVNQTEKDGEPGVDDDGNGYVDDVHGYDFANKDGDPMDGHGHGTHCSGVIGAVHNRAGIAGVMANVKVMGIKFLTDRGSGTTAGAIESVNYAIKAGVDVMSNSWGGGGRSEALFEAIKKANDKGIVFVAAAGNSRANNDRRNTYPANYKVDNVISVGAMNGKGKKASFSNYGDKTVHVFAPGVNILSTVKDQGYKKMSGTSMACPHVSGAVGLLLSSETNLTPAEVRERVMATAVDNGNLSKYTVSGRMDAFRMLKNTTK
ncbi:MAG: S8 family serine peptidase [Bacteriovoracaceae bacterium]|jgi:thermitase|nr:S8 family serine peptidase [Bacteriovoracaceae bacterium]